MANNTAANYNSDHDEGKTFDISMASIDACPNNPRSELGDLTELEASIKANGLLQPIIVRHGKNHHYEVVAGSRRFQAVKNLGLPCIRATLVDVDDRTAVEIATAENIVRQDMSASDECRAVMSMVDSGKDIRTVAVMFGKSVKWALGREKMARLGEDILKMIDDGELTLAHAEVLTMCRTDEDVRRFAKSATYTSPENMRLRILAEMSNLAKAPFDVRKVCKNCEKQTVNQQDIFGDVTDSYCRDGECFRKNVDKVIERKKAEFADNGLKECPDIKEWDFRHGYGWIDVDAEHSEKDEETIAKLKKLGKVPYYLVDDGGNATVKWFTGDLPKSEQPGGDSSDDTDWKRRNRINEMVADMEKDVVRERVEEILGGLSDTVCALLLAAFTTNTYDYTQVDDDGDEVDMEESPLDHIGETYTDNSHKDGISPKDLLVEETADGLCNYGGVDSIHRGYFELDKFGFREKAEKMVDEEPEEEDEE